MERSIRKIVQAVEHQTVEIAFTDLFNGQTLDIYEETIKFFQISFRKGVPCLQLGKHLGLIPVNDRLAIEVSSRVPIENLERIVALADGYEPLILPQHQNFYEKIDDRPASLIESIASQFLSAVEQIVHDGLWLEYRSIRHIGAFPAGRIEPFESSWRSRKSGVPVGVSVAFFRSPATAANNWILAALRKLDYTMSDSSMRPKMVRQMALCRRSFEPCAIPGFDSFDFRSLEMITEAIPAGRMLYLNALRLALLILSNSGIDLRDRSGKTMLNSIFVDMEAVFEIYVREVLRRQLQSRDEIQILDGNKGGIEGAKKGLFSSIPMGSKNPDATPDIVVHRDGICRLILDAKYKPLTGLPDRSDLNQLATYAVSYNCPQVALLYPRRSKEEAHFTILGNMNMFDFLVARFDLSATDIEAEEKAFVEATTRLLAFGDQPNRKGT